MAQEKEARGQRREVKQRDEDEANSQQLKGCTIRIRTPLSQKSFQLSCDLSYTRSAWQKFRHRLGSFPQPAAHHGEAGGGGEACVDVLLVLMLIQVGERTSLIKRPNSL